MTGLLVNKWRKQNGLAKVTNFDYYLIRNGKRMLTLYLVSGKYDERAKELSIQIKKENGIEKAIKMLTENVSITDGHGRQEGGTCDRTGI